MGTHTFEVDDFYPYSEIKARGICKAANKKSKNTQDTQTTENIDFYDGVFPAQTGAASTIWN